MSKVKSEVAAAGAAEGIATPDKGAVAVVQGGGAVANVGSGAMSFGTVNLGDDDSNGDSARPLACLHISHNLSEKEPQGCVKGSVWLARKTDLVWPCKVTDVEKKFNFIPFSVGHSWREVVAFGSGIIPRTFASKAEADAAGMITDYQPAGTGKRRNCVPVYCMWVLIEQPADVRDESMFFFELDGKRYAPAEVYVDKTKSYNSLKATLQSAMGIINAKFCGSKTEISAIALTGVTRFADVKLETGATRKIPYMYFDVAKNDDGIVMFTTDKFRQDLAKQLASSQLQSSEETVD